MRACLNLSSSCVRHASQHAGASHITISEMLDYMLVSNVYLLLAFLTLC
jgi:hypothetical protein